MIRGVGNAGEVPSRHVSHARTLPELPRVFLGLRGFLGSCTGMEAKSNGGSSAPFHGRFMRWGDTRTLAVDRTRTRTRTRARTHTTEFIAASCLCGCVWGGGGGEGTSNRNTRNARVHPCVCACACACACACTSCVRRTIHP